MQLEINVNDETAVQTSQLGFITAWQLNSETVTL